MRNVTSQPNLWPWAKRPQFLIPAAVFTVVYVTHFLSGVIASGDSRWCIHTAQSILQEGNANLDEYPDDLKDNDYYWIEKIDGHCYTRFPIGASLVALPFVFVIDHAFKIAFPLIPTLEPFLIRHCGKPLTHITVTTIHWRIELAIACFVVALASVFMYLLAREILSVRTALLITFLYAFCTSSWSIASRSMGQHGPSMLMLGIALYLYVVARRRPAVAQYISLPLAFAYVVRPTNSIPIAIITLCVLLEYRRYFVKYLLWAAPVTIPFVLYNFHIYHAPISTYYLPQRLGSTTTFLEALAGLLVSPSRGLVVYTPVCLLCFVGVIRKARAGGLLALDYGLIAISLVHWVAVASFGDWWGGHSYGPRYFTDLTPFFVYLLIPVFQYFESHRGNASLANRTTVAALVAFSFLVHARGATDLRTWAWNREPVDVNDAPQRLWDWCDPQFLRDLF